MEYAYTFSLINDNFSVESLRTLMYVHGVAFITLDISVNTP